MLNWLVGLWREMVRWVHREKPPVPTYHRSNLHGRVR